MREIGLPFEDVMRALTGIELLQHCSDDEKLAIVRAARVFWFQDGEIILREGDVGLAFYFILSGVAEVRRGNRTVAHIDSGGYFGEASLLEGIPRTADVFAFGETVVLGVERSDFRSLLVREAQLAMELLFEEKRRLHQLSVVPAS
ncbi:MAG: cyclic nucleotide-binding domain-containing protein [Actinomycetota bacterium]